MKKIRMGQNDIEAFIAEVREKLSLEKGLPDTLSMPINASTKLKDEDKVQVIFDNVAYKKMQALISKCSDEVGWYGIVEHPEEKIYEITDIIMFPQTVTGATVTTDDDEYGAWIAGLDDEVLNKLRFYGHSHVNMGTSPSMTDTNHYKNMIQNCHDFYIFGILNKSNSSWFNIYDFSTNTLYEKDDIEYKYYITSEDEWAKEQIETFVKKKTYNYTSSYGYGSQYTYGNKPVTPYGQTAFNKAKQKEKEEKKKTKNHLWDYYADYNKDLDLDDYYD